MCIPTEDIILGINIYIFFINFGLYQTSCMDPCYEVFQLIQLFRKMLQHDIAVKCFVDEEIYIFY